MPVDGKLIPTGGGDDIHLVREHLTIGRRETCDICLRFPNVSGRHAELTYQDGYWTVRDLGSTNGIKVNGEMVRNRNLSPGDEITIASDETQHSARVRIVGQSVLIPPVFFEAGPGEGIATNTATMRLLGADRAHSTGLVLFRFANETYASVKRSGGDVLPSRRQTKRFKSL